MPWPTQLAKSVRIGRIAGNDIVLDDPRVSGQHARLTIVAGSHVLLEDLGSSNGTFLNSAEQRVTRPTPLSASDTVYFGSLAVPAARLLAGLVDVAAPVLVPVPVPQPSVAVKAPTEAPVARKPAAGIGGNRWLVIAIAQVPLLAILIVLIGGRHASEVTPENWSSVGQGIAATAFALAIAAVWLGCSTAVAAIAGGIWPGREQKVDSQLSFGTIGVRFAVLTSVCALGCALLLAIVYWATGLKGPWLFMAVMLVMASLVGLLLGLLISEVVGKWQTVAAVLIGCIALMIAVSGWLWPLAGKGMAASVVAGVTPARWAFESLLLVESPHHAAPTIEGGPIPAPERDLAEIYFPAESERMGPQADAMALGSMVLGLAAAVALASAKPR
jgi:hypothetical protein